MEGLVFDCSGPTPCSVSSLIIFLAYTDAVQAATGQEVLDLFSFSGNTATLSAILVGLTFGALRFRPRGTHSLNCSMAHRSLALHCDQVRLIGMDIGVTLTLETGCASSEMLVVHREKLYRQHCLLAAYKLEGLRSAFREFNSSRDVHWQPARNART